MIYFNRPFFFRVRRVEVATLTLTLRPSTTKVRFWMFGLKTLRVFLWEKETLWPYNLPFPEISQTAILFLLYCVSNCFKSFWLIDGEVRENFAVDSDVFCFHTSDELRIGKAFSARSVIDSGDPEGAEVAFFVATIAISIT